MHLISQNILTSPPTHKCGLAVGKSRNKYGIWVWSHPKVDWILVKGCLAEVHMSITLWVEVFTSSLCASCCCVSVCICLLWTSRSFLYKYHDCVHWRVWAIYLSVGFHKQTKSLRVIVGAERKNHAVWEEKQSLGREWKQEPKRLQIWRETESEKIA